MAGRLERWTRIAQATVRWGLPLTALAALVAALLAGLPVPGAPEEAMRVGPRSAPAGGRRPSDPPPRSTNLEPPASEAPDEAAARQQLLSAVGGPAPDRMRRREWAERQADAIRAHLTAYPASPDALSLYHWMLVIEVQILGRYERAESALDALEERLRSGGGPELEPAAIRALWLRVQLYARWRRPNREAAAIRRLLPRLGAAEQALMAGRLFELEHLQPGAALPPIEGRDLDGRLVRPELWEGKVLLLDLWHLADDHAAEDFAERARALRAQVDGDLVMVGVPLARSEGDVRAFLAEHPRRGPQIFDPALPGNDHPIARRLAPMGCPTSFLVDRGGTIRYRDIRGPELLAAIEKLCREPRREGR
ncbi:MAG: TlpA family protein disulfide reductase [Planctomycetes bacterium]|nr:TlpA family protein disulfide reductase [Planctomycetota bacterium]